MSAVIKTKREWNPAQVAEADARHALVRQRPPEERVLDQALNEWGARSKRPWLGIRHNLRSRCLQNRPR